MEKEEIQKRLNLYLEALEEARKRVGDEQVAIAIIHEVAKDVRMERMRMEREASNGQPATPKQLEYLKSLGVSAPEGVTKKEASRMIDEALDK